MSTLSAHEMRALYLAGLTLREIAERDGGISYSTVRTILIDLGVTLRQHADQGIVHLKLNRKMTTCLARISKKSPQDAVLALIADAYLAKTGEVAPIEKQRPA